MGVDTAVVLWEADGRTGRPEHVAYRESLGATYQGPYTLGERTAWDGLVSNRPGLVTTDPERGFDLTMRAGEARAGAYTTRDIASAPHGEDYGPAFEAWAAGGEVPPNLVVPGRMGRWSGVRMEHLALGADCLGTSGCCIQDWAGIDFETMAVHGNVAQSRYAGGGFAVLPAESMFGAALAAAGDAATDNPFGRAIPGVAPLNAVFSRVGAGFTAQRCWIDPAAPHELTIAWTADGTSIVFAIDGQTVLEAVDGAPSLLPGLPPIEFNRCAMHVDSWQDNGSGDPNVTGVDGHADRDQVYTVESLAVLAVP
jgi:hypothetical protein